ncbi:uncharacterized protein PG986_004458 [Apiospora aurea]|uniref:Uncharacterized protein n=1 Tax=Apiospora aurea TaxID=335848 RepID=A0ABR1QPA0_9PEZI
MEQSAGIEIRCPTPVNSDYHLGGMDQDILSAMGYDPGESISRLKPYLRWIKSSSPGVRKKEDYLRLFTDVVLHFRREGDQPHHMAIQPYVNELATSQPDHYYFNDTSPGSAERLTSVEDTVLIIIGVWTLMKPYFSPTQGNQKRVVVSFCHRYGIPYSEARAFDQSPSDLIRSCGLLPHADESAWLSGTAETSRACVADQSSVSRTADFSFGLHSGLIESHIIETKVLNANRLLSLAGVRIAWTDNISLHLLLSRSGQRHYLELFALPCALRDRETKSPNKSVISPSLVYEVQSTYANLFNPIHCWCLGCASWRIRTREIKTLSQDTFEKNRRVSGWSAQLPYDPEIELLMRQEATSWNQVDFRDLWPRILELDHHLQAARPWNFWVLFRDSRDTIQYWTFLFGSIILFLTVVQVALGAAQVAGSGSG